MIVKDKIKIATEALIWIARATKGNPLMGMKMINSQAQKALDEMSEPPNTDFNCIHGKPVKGGGVCEDCKRINEK